MKHVNTISRSPQPVPADSLLVVLQQIEALGGFVAVLDAIFGVVGSAIDISSAALDLFRDAFGKD